MNKYLRIVISLIVSLSLFSCTKEIPAELNVTTTELSFTKDGGSQSISFSTNKDWTAYSPVSWAKVTSSGSSSATSINVTVEANTDYFDRTATITIKAENLTKTVNIYQGQTNGLFLTTSEYAVSNAEHDITVEVKANVEFVVSSEADWITYVETKGLKTSNLSLNIAKNETYDNRVGTVKVKQTNGALEGTITINQEGNTIISIPDADFKAYCVANFDTNGDREISTSEASVVSEINVARYDGIGPIISLEGIEYFTSLVNLFCRSNRIESIDVSKNTKLIVLDCSQNCISNLVIGNNSLLERLDCSCNYTNWGGGITSLDISMCTALVDLYCSNNKLTSLDISNTALVTLSCPFNQLSNLDVSNNTSLKYLNCNNNQLTSLDVSKNTALTSLSCDNNQLTSIDVINNAALTILNCGGNQLASLDVSNNTTLTSLDCNSNQLTSIDISKNAALTSLVCGNNPLSSLDVSKNTALTSLVCDNNPLSNLDVSKNSSLINLSCKDNQLTSLDVRKNTALTYLRCCCNQLTNIDVSNNTSLNYLDCNNNQLTSLDVSKNTALWYLGCNNNPSLTELWLKTGQTIQSLEKDSHTQIKYKD